MDSIIWLLISTGILLILLLAVAIFFKRKSKVPTDYYSLFVMGIIWFAIGIPIENYALSVIGAVFLIIGLANKKKWKQNRKKWKDLDSSTQRWTIALMIILGILVLVGIVLLIIFS